MTLYSANYSVISRRQLWVGMRTRDVLMASSLSECVASRLSLYTVVSVSNYELKPKNNNNNKNCSVFAEEVHGRANKTRKWQLVDLSTKWAQPRLSFVGPYVSGQSVLLETR